MENEKNIVAISTAMGNGAISIIRMSGKGVINIAEKVFHTNSLSPKNFEPRKLYLGTFSYNDISDKCMCVYFKAPNSYTGEDIIEFQCHGGVTLTNKIYSCLVDAGCTPATKGEFSKLAFLNGKISLDEAEGIIDMINAESESELKAGYDLCQGKLKNKVEDIQNKLTELLAKIEVAMDYPEEDLEEETNEDIKASLLSIKEELLKILETASFGKAIKQGTKVLIYGKTNAGKSSLLNSLLDYDRAIVTDIQGTTRDVLEETFIYHGYKFILMDSAGIRKTDDLIENIGISKSKESINIADIILFVLDGSKELNNDDFDIIKSLSDKNVVLVNNKCDLCQKANIDSIPFINKIDISTKTNKNIDKLKDLLLEFVISKNTNNNSVVITNTRHIKALENAITNLDLALNSINSNLQLDLVSIDIKSIWSELGNITGNSDNEKIIDDIFSKFCVGK